MMPDPASDSRHFYCSCGAGYTAAHAFHAHCRRTGHTGNWSRSRYQPKGHGSSTSRKLRRPHTILDRVRRSVNAGVRKAGKSARLFGKSIGKHKGKLSAVLLSTAVIAVLARSLQSQPMVSNVASNCREGWLLDLNTSTHVVKESEYYSNVDSILGFDAQDARDSAWTGAVPLYFNSGDMILLEDVLYNAHADTNIVSWRKLHESGLFTDFTATGATIYSATDNGPVGRAILHQDAYCIEDLAPPPSATTYPSRSIAEPAVEASTSEIDLLHESAQYGSYSGMFGSVVSDWSSRFGHFQPSKSRPVTTTYPPFQRAPKPISTGLSGLTATDTILTTTPRAMTSTSPTATLPYEAVSEISSAPSETSDSMAIAAKRKLGDHFEISEELIAKRNRTGTSVQDRIGHLLLGLGEKLANVTKNPLSWSLPRPPSMTRSQDNLGWDPFKVPNSTSAPSSHAESASSAGSVEEAPITTSWMSAWKSARATSQWNLPSTFPAVGIRVDTREYSLNKRSESQIKEADSRLELEDMIKQVEDHACPPREQCEKCWLS
jgi:hypothetical protein